MDLNTGPVWTVWSGGYGSYSPGEVPADVEHWSTLEAALDAADQRRRMGHHWPQDFPYVNREPDRALTPCVGDNSYVDVFLSPPEEGDERDARYEWSETCEEYVEHDPYDDGGPCCLGHARGSDHDPDCYAR